MIRSVIGSADISSFVLSILILSLSVSVVVARKPYLTQTLRLSTKYYSFILHLTIPICMLLLVGFLQV